MIHTTLSKIILCKKKKNKEKKQKVVDSDMKFNNIIKLSV